MRLVYEMRIEGKKKGTRNILGMCVLLEKSNNKEIDGRLMKKVKIVRKKEEIIDKI
jgi:hypothetical protein